MRLASLLFLSFFVAAPLFAQKNTTDASGKKQGVWEKTYKSGAIKYKGQFKNDEPVGTFQYFYSDGVTKTKVKHVGNGKAYATHFYPNNAKQSEGIYLNQKKDSVWSFYGPNGKIVSKESYKNDLKNGEAVNYYQNGNISLVAEYKGDRKHGLEVTFAENKAKLSERNYANGAFHGPFAVYDIKGNPVFEGTFENGKEVGEWKEYSKGGVLYRRIFKRENRKDSILPDNGEHITLYPNEMPKEISNYKAGALHGKSQLFYDNGRWEIVDKVDPRTGDSDKYRQMVGHTVKETCDYVYGKKHGKCIYYFEDGSVKKEETYEMGKLQK